MIAVLYASHHNEHVRRVCSILETQCVPFKLYGGDNTWKGFGQKLQCAARAARELTEEHILFIDAHDVIVLGGPDALLARFEGFRHPWVCNAEPNIWPPNSFPPETYPVCNSPWRYLNSGAYMAERRYLAECFDRWGVPEAGVDDQHWLADRFLKEPGSIKLDTECSMFQTLIGGAWAFEIDNGRLYNTVTDAFPLVLHHNGGGDIIDYKGVLW